MNFTNLKNKLMPHSFYEILGAFVVVWLIIFLLLRMFVSVHGHRTWWQAMFGHDDTKSQLVSPVPQTDDNKARLALLDFYNKYSTASDGPSRKALVAKNSSANFNNKYLNSTNGDLVSCTSSKVNSVQITAQVLFAKNLSYRLVENGSSGTLARPLVSLAKTNGTYQIIGISCGPSL